MNRRSKVLAEKRKTTGSVLVTVLVIAIIVVLVLMWQAGIFSSTANTPDTNRPASAATTAEPARRDSAAITPSQPAAAADPTTGETPVQKPDGKDAASIQAVADSLIAAHPIDLSACRAETDANEALNCAASAQTVALQAAFVDYNARRAAGDLVANARGGEVMKRIVAALQKQLQPFEDAVN